MWKGYFNNNSRILFTCNTPCNISEIFKFGWYLKKIYSRFQAIMNVITMKILIKILLKSSLLRRLSGQLSHVRCNVRYTYLNILIFVRVNWFRRMLVRARAIERLSGWRLYYIQHILTPLGFCVWLKGL